MGQDSSHFLLHASDVLIDLGGVGERGGKLSHDVWGASGIVEDNRHVEGENQEVRNGNSIASHVGRTESGQVLLHLLVELVKESDALSDFLGVRSGFATEEQPVGLGIPEISMRLERPVDVVGFLVVALLSIVAVLAAEQTHDRCCLVHSASLSVLPDRDLTGWEGGLGFSELLTGDKLVVESNTLVPEKHTDRIALRVEPEVCQGG